MAITAGTYTIGQAGSGADYETVMQAFYDISKTGITGDINLNVIDDCLMYPSTWTDPNWGINIKNFTVTINTLVYHNGYFGAHSPTIYIGDGYCGFNRKTMFRFAVNNIDNAKFIVSNCKFKIKTTHNINDSWFSGAIAAYNSSLNYNFFWIFYNNLLDSSERHNGSGSYDTGIYLFNNIGNLHAYRNVIYDNTFRTSSLSIGAGTARIENNTLIGAAPLASLGGVSALEYFRNNLIIASSIYVITNTTWYNNASNKAFTGFTGSDNIGSLALNIAGDEYIESYDLSSPDFLKLKKGTVLTTSGISTGLYAGNTTGIRGNTSPNSIIGMSIGADQFTPITDVSLGGFDLPYPQYPYKTDIFFSWDFVKSSTDKYHFFDNGALYDKRKCVATFLLSEAEAEKLKQLWNSYKTSYTTTPLALIMGDDSGWFPFGQDKGNKGEFKVELNLLSKIERSKTHFNYFEVTLELINVGAYPDYTFVDEVNEGSFAISNATSTYSISNIRTPEYAVEGQYGTFTNQNEGGTDYNRTIELNEETQETRFILNTNLSKMQRVLKLITDNRTGNYTIFDGGGNIFGYSFNLLQENLKLVENKFTVTANRFNDYTIDLRFTNE
jgi:hypothetical protein